MRNHSFEGATVWACHKGGNSKAEMARADQISDQQLQLQQQQLQAQLGQLNAVNAVADPMIANGGMTPAQEAALRSIQLNQSGQTLKNSIGQINSNLVARGVTGGPFAGSGDVARDYGSFYNMQNALTQQGLSNVELAKQQQLMQLLGIKMGIGGQYGTNVSTFGNQGVSALNSGVNAASNADQASTGFWGSLIGSGLGLIKPFSLPGTKP